MHPSMFLLASVVFIVPTHAITALSTEVGRSENAERLDGENGLLLTPSIDHLFDRGFISFKDDGAVLISPVADERSLKRMGVEAGMGAGEFRGRSAYSMGPWAFVGPSSAAFTLFFLMLKDVQNP
jgi:hypothetical protein